MIHQEDKKNFRLKIDMPCTENWDNMQPNEQGRFCMSCQKTVIDFTQMSDAEIVQFFAQYKGEKVCGVFRNSQIQKTYPKVWQAPLHHRSFWRTAFAGMALLTLLAQPFSGAANAVWTNPEKMEWRQNNHKNDPINEGNRLLKIQVKSAKTGEVLPYAMAAITVGERQLDYVSADGNGFITIDVSDEVFGKGFRLLVTAAYHKNNKIFFSRQKIQHLKELYTVTLNYRKPHHRHHKMMGGVQLYEY